MAAPSLNRIHTARRSENKGRRSASPAAAAIRLVPIALMASLLLLIIHSGRLLAVPLAERVAASASSLRSGPNLSQTSDQARFSTFTPEVQRWGDHIRRWAQAYDLEPVLIATVIQIESCGDPLALSPAGAAGLFQVMPFHFQPGQDPIEIETNAQAGLTYLARSNQLAQGDLRLTLAGYNGGHGVIERAPSEWPAETQRYAAWGAGIMLDIQGNQLPSPTLTRWLEAGGQHLCQQAATAQVPIAADSSVYRLPADGAANLQ